MYLCLLETGRELSVETCVRSLAGFFFLPLVPALRCCFLRIKLSLELPAVELTLDVRFLRHSSVELDTTLCDLRPDCPADESPRPRSMRISEAPFVVCGFGSPVNLATFVSISLVGFFSDRYTRTKSVTKVTEVCKSFC